MMTRGPFSGGDDTPWPGAWRFGVDFADAEKGSRVIAVCSAGGKYDFKWLGPVVLSDDTIPALEQWAEERLDLVGGYVHLLSADGEVDPKTELLDADEEEDEELEER